MITDIITDSLMQQGYVQSSRDRRTAEFMIKVTDDRKMYICSIIKNYDGTHVMAEQIVESAKQLERKFLLSGYSDVSVMHIILSQQDEDVEMLEAGGVNFWIVDLRTGRLMIYENQPEDYASLRGVIEKGLMDSGKQTEMGRSPGRWSYSLKNLPFVTIAIALVNIVVFILCEIIGSTENIDFMVKAGALNYELVFQNGEYYRMFSSMFLHFGFEHIVNNMFSLYIVGEKVENWLGHLRFVCVYLISGFGASVVSLIYHMLMNDNTISAGASGAIYGIFGAMIVMLVAMRNENNDISMSRIGIVVALLILGSIQEEVDFAAHIGGFVVGLISTMAFARYKKQG